MYWYGASDEARHVLAEVLTYLRRRAVIFGRPEQPYRTAVDALAAVSGEVVAPGDFETRIFLTDLPVANGFSVEALCRALSGRRAAIVPGWGVVAAAKESLEAAFVLYCAACFACFVKFFGDLLTLREGDRARAILREALEKVKPFLDMAPEDGTRLAAGPFRGERAMAACMEAGMHTVRAGLVDANFGNVSYRDGELLYISRRGAPLDELEGGIIPVDLTAEEGGSLQVSTEYPTHREIVLHTEYRAVLHGHPKFAVALSLACPERWRCEGRYTCHRFCPRERWIEGIPIVSGEAGGGAVGLHRTVPNVINRCGGVIAHGHGVFTAGKTDFREAFAVLQYIEGLCRRTVLCLIDAH